MEGVLADKAARRVDRLLREMTAPTSSAPLYGIAAVGDGADDEASSTSAREGSREFANRKRRSERGSASIRGLRVGISCRIGMSGDSAEALESWTHPVRLHQREQRLSRLVQLVEEGGEERMQPRSQSNDN